MGIFPCKNLDKVWKQWTKDWELEKLREQERKENARNEIEVKLKSLIVILIIIIFILSLWLLGCTAIGTADRPAMMSKWRGQPVTENLLADFEYKLVKKSTFGATNWRKE